MKPNDLKSNIPKQGDDAVNRSVSQIYTQAPVKIPGLIEGETNINAIQKKVEMWQVNEGVFIRRGAITALVPMTNIKVVIFAQ